MAPPFLTLTLDALTVDDEAGCRHVPLYADLKEVVRRGRCRFRVMRDQRSARWDRALLLNHTFWGAEGGDVLVNDHIAADVVAHVAWHHLAARAVGSRSAEALVFGEAVASAFDVYLVGAQLGRVKRSAFLDTQVPAMADVAKDAGLSARGFEKLLASIAGDPALAFEDLRALLFDVATGLLTSDDAASALTNLASFDGHRFAPLLHHYALSTWVLFAKAHASLKPNRKVRAVDAALRAAPSSSLSWLTSRWVGPALR